MTAKDYKKKKRIFFAASMMIMTYVLLFYIIYGYVTTLTGAKDDGIVKQIMMRLIPYGVTAVALLLCCILISNKLRTTVWMANAILGTILFSRYGLLATFVFWIIDEYVLFRLYNKYKLRAEMAAVRDEVKQ